MSRTWMPKYSSLYRIRTGRRMARAAIRPLPPRDGAQVLLRRNAIAAGGSQ